MNILITPTNGYAGYAGVVLTSIFENDKDTKFNVYILTTGFDEENTRKMAILAECYNQTINIIQLSKEDSETQVPGKWGISTYTKLFAPDYLDLDKVLYLDIDIIVVKKLSTIIEYDLSNFYLALPPDASTSEAHKKRLGIPQENYFGCCGIMYMNLKKMREDNIKAKSLSFINDNFKNIHFADQDVINSVCTGYILKLPMRYNMMAFFFRNEPLLTKDNQKDFVSELKQMVIIHYTCTKPWFSDCDMPLKYEFRKYVHLSPWKIKYKKSNDYKQVRYLITRIRYLIQHFNIKSYPYLFISRKKLKNMIER